MKIILKCEYPMDMFREKTMEVVFTVFYKTLNFKRIKHLISLQGEKYVFLLNF